MIGFVCDPKEPVQTIDETISKLKLPRQADCGNARAIRHVLTPEHFIRFRNVDKLEIEQVWMNVYHGGTVPSSYDQHLFIDNVVIAL